MTTSTERLTGVLGLTGVSLLAANLSFTAEGPRPAGNPAAEAARIAADADAVRLSAVLGALAMIAFTGFFLGMAAIALRDSRLAGWAAAAGAGAQGALALTSSAALAASVQAAERHLGAGMTMGFGELETTTLLLSFVPMGVAFLAFAASGAFGRVASLTAAILGVCAIASIGTFFSMKLDEGPFGAPLVVAFFGFPLWTLGMSVGLLGLRRRSPATPSTATV